jgi:tetratricopeptide (TPR) repeat protein
MSSSKLRTSALIGLVIIAALTIGVAVGYLFSSLQVVALPPAQLTGPASAEAMVLKAQLEYFERRAEDLQKLASVVLLFSTLFAAVAGISTYLNLNQAIEKATSAVNSAEKHFADASAKADAALLRLDRALEEVAARADSEISEIRRAFPMFGYMNHVIARILGEFSALLDQDFLSSPSIGRIDLFRQLSPEKRQRMFFYEKCVAALAMMDLRSYSSEMSRIYRGLGIFFGSRAYSRGTTVSDADLERAMFYFDRANRVDAESPVIYNDMAYFALTENRPDLWSRAESMLMRSLDLLDNQQRPRLLLSFVYIKRHDFPNAERVLIDGLARTSWEPGYSQLRDDKLHYNYACALSGAGKLEQAIEHLRKAFSGDVRRDLWEFLRADLASTADEIQNLAVSDKYGPEVKEIFERTGSLFRA